MSRRRRPRRSASEPGPELQHDVARPGESSSVPLTSVTVALLRRQDVIAKHNARLIEMRQDGTPAE